jgi:hypothetical protein
MRGKGGRQVRLAHRDELVVALLQHDAIAVRHLTLALLLLHGVLHELQRGGGGGGGGISDVAVHTVYNNASTGREERARRGRSKNGGCNEWKPR